METITLQPTSAGYSIGIAGDRISAKLNGPASTVGTNRLNVPRQVTLNWETDYNGYEYLKSIFRKNAARANPIWQMTVALDGEITPVLHKLKFIAGSIQFQGRLGMKFLWSAKAFVLGGLIGKPGYYTDIKLHTAVYGFFNHDYGIINSGWIYGTAQQAADAAQAAFDADHSNYIPPHSPPPMGRYPYRAKPNTANFLVNGNTAGDPTFPPPYWYYVYGLEAAPRDTSFYVGAVFGRFIPEDDWIPDYTYIPPPAIP